MIVAGLGFNSKATPDSLADALDATGYATSVSVLATPEDKIKAPVILDFAKSRGLLVLPIQPHQLEAAQTHTQSVVSRMMRRIGSVAEAAALAAAGPNAALLATRKISDDRTATCAIAKGATP